MTCTCLRQHSISLRPLWSALQEPISGALERRCKGSPLPHVGSPGDCVTAGSDWHFQGARPASQASRGSVRWVLGTCLEFFKTPTRSALPCLLHSGRSGGAGRGIACLEPRPPLHSTAFVIARQAACHTPSTAVQPAEEADALTNSQWSGGLGLTEAVNAESSERQAGLGPQLSEAVGP